MEVITSALNHKNDELFTLIKSQMSETDEELFMTSYYLYLEYGKDNTAFVVDFDMVWKWAGFATVGNAKTLLKKHFIENRDFKTAFAVAEAVLECGQKQNGGQNKEKILLNPKIHKIDNPVNQVTIMAGFIIIFINLFSITLKIFEASSLLFST